MAEIIPDKVSTGRRTGPRVDMTPMVDLAFLLLTFFVLAASLIKPKTVEIIYPDAEGDPSPINKKYALTVLLGHSREQLCYYRGVIPKSSDELMITDFSARGLRGVLMQSNSNVIEVVEQLRQEKESGSISDEIYRVQYAGAVGAYDATMVIVKTCDDTPYEMIISILDEMNLTDIRKRVIQPASSQEMRMMQEIFSK